MTTHPEHGLEDGPDTTTETPARRPRGPDPLSAASRRKLLAPLMKAADAGDVSAQRALVELSLVAKRDEAVADTLRRLKAEGEDGV